MPHYEFFCHNCKKLFSKILSLVDYEEGDILCPHCGSKEVEQRWSVFSVITTKKSA
jgi:putative FmdB family regulatory protein